VTCLGLVSATYVGRVSVTSNAAIGFGKKQLSRDPRSNPVDAIAGQHFKQVHDYEQHK
jgi:hypothetical protein